MPVHTKQLAVSIIPPSPKDILISRYAQLGCRTEKEGGFKSIKWLDSSGQDIASELDTDKSRVTLNTRISFEDWSNGTKFTCEVENSAFTQQFKTVDY